MNNLKKYKSNICKNNIVIRKTLILLNIIKLKCLIVIDVKKKLIHKKLKVDPFLIDIDYLVDFNKAKKLYK
tara:strand:+ start:296 stop:508 length:213 start_codon:yes stop_codon:yes gene_type:complete